MLRAGTNASSPPRIMIAASESVSITAPQILQVTVAVTPANLATMISMPRRASHSGGAALAVATRAEINASYNAINSARSSTFCVDAETGRRCHCARAMRRPLMKSWGNHEGYRYAHDWPGAVSATVHADN